ncbi:MAG: DNA polymerase III subunit beta, partial [Muribaculaceae bacterium]
MKFVVSSKALLSRLSAVSKVVNSKNAIAILDYFLFDLENGVLTVTGSDQENTLTTHFEVEEAEGNGSFAIKVKNILDVLKGMNDQNLSFEINEENYEINIDYQNGNYNFVGLNGRDFPEKLVTEEEVKKFTLPAKDVLS